MAASMEEKVHMLENSSESEVEEDDYFSDDGFDADEEEILNDAIDDEDEGENDEDEGEDDEDEDEDDKDEGEDDEEEEENKEDDEKKETHSHGLANVMTRILTKKVPTDKVILAKALTDKQLEKRKLEKEEEGGEKKLKIEDETDLRRNYKIQQEKIKQWENLARVKPDPLERNKERQLQRIATRGVVQLFNAVKKQQKSVEEEVKKVKTEKKKEQVMADMDKYKFLDILKGTSTSNVQLGPKNKKVKTEIKEEKMDEKEKKWNILREDYMMGAKMKDWNKSSDDDDGEDDDGPPDPDISDSD